MTEKIILGGIERHIGDKLDFMLTNNIIQWEELLKAHEKYKKNEIFFEEVLRILGFKENKNLLDLILPMSKKIYNLPDRFHIISMIKQYFIYEPLSLVIHNIFMLLKNHYEKIIYDFIAARNKYIIDNKLDENTNKIIDMNFLMDYWNDINLQNNIDTSSLLLYFINTPENIDNKLDIKIPDANKNIKNSIQNLENKIKKFYYPGFCSKMPYTRLKKLLKFPLEPIIKVIRLLNKDYKTADYKLIENSIKDILNNFKIINPLNSQQNLYIRNKNPIMQIYKKIEKQEKINKLKKDQDKSENNKIIIETIKWYVDETLKLRQKLLPEAKKLEKYYNELAKLFDNVYQILKLNIE